MKRLQYRDEPPDGGWGWMVVLSSFLSHVFVVGGFKSFGVFFPYFREEFSEDAANTSWVSSIQGAVVFFGSGLAGALGNRFGCRPVVMAGSLVAAAGLISSMFVTSMATMYVTTGLVTGLGFSLMYTPCITMVGLYFNKRRSLATGIGVSGAGVGVFVFPPLFQLLIDNYGWKNALLIFSGIMLNGSVFGALLRPLYLKSTLTSGTLEHQESHEEETVGVCSRVSNTFGFYLFKDPYFAAFSFCQILISFGAFVPFVHLVAHARDLGIEPQPAAFLVSVIGITDMLSRIGYGWLSDSGLFVRMRGYIVCVTGFGLCHIFVPFAHTYAGLVAYCLFFGAFQGCCLCQVAVILADICGVKRLGSAIGLCYTVTGLALLFGPPMAGHLFDVTGNYQVSFWVSGGLVLLSLLLLLPVEFHRTVTARQDPGVLDSATDDTDGGYRVLNHTDGPEKDRDVFTSELSTPFIDRETTLHHVITSPTIIYNMAKKRNVQYHDEPPDGGWGWLVVLATFLSHVFVIATFKSFGVFFPYFQESFDQDAASTAWVSSIMGSVTLFGSLPAGALCNMFGCRAVVMTGSLLATTGLLSSMAVTSLAVMNLTAGFITGIGFSLMYTPCITTVGRYFKRRLALANGIGISGSGLGAFALPPVFQLLIDEYGWRGSLFIVAGVALQGCVFGALLRPISLRADIQEKSTHVTDEPTSRNTNRGPLARLCVALDLSLLKMPYFVVFNIIMMFLVVGFGIPFVHLVKHARNVGLEPQQAAFLVSAVGIADCLARIGYGWLFSLGLYPLLRGFVVCSLGLGLCLVFLPFAQTYQTMVICCIFIGVFMGCLSTKTAVFLAEFCGVKRLASAVGISFGVRGFTMLLSPPFAGYLYDVTGNYNVSFYVAGGSVLFSSLMTSALEFHRTRNVQRQNLDMPGSEDMTRKTLSNDTDEKMDRDDSNVLLIFRETSV
ncbi:PREDICTED: uncharacterized protein LOC109485688 [Branchiostoma belcheri]|uniref:Monocarboxylate transporter 13 n=1 Tax=Branchiostoma belcheri TaxID=7741 RepID=A0A6P5A5W3_BRABE|nr:PREDICTED: uncharacterized protein LOC109485688 [Branchiostoma belcheri]